MYFVVTGAAGFIGSNLVRALNARGETRILAVDDLQRSDKFRNLAACEISDFLDKDEFRRRLEAGDFFRRDRRRVPSSAVDMRGTLVSMHGNRASAFDCDSSFPA